MQESLKLLNAKQQQALSKLKNKAQKIRYLRYIQGIPRSETAVIMGVIYQYVRNVEEITRDRHIDTVKELLAKKNSK